MTVLAYICGTIVVTAAVLFTEYAIREAKMNAAAKRAEREGRL